MLCSRGNWSRGYITGAIWTTKMYSIVRESGCKCPACGFNLRRELQEEKNAAAKEKALQIRGEKVRAVCFITIRARQPSAAVTTSKANKKKLPEIAGSQWIQRSGKGKGSGVRKMFKVSVETDASSALQEKNEGGGHTGASRPTASTTAPDK